MSIKSVFKKIGKVALMAAPYVAAPFTGGASLLATGLANKAVSKWSEHDAKDAIAHGLAPSKFDNILNKVGTVSSLASSIIPTNALGAVGLLGKAGKTAQTAVKAGSAANKVGSILSNAGKVSNVLSAVGGLRDGGGGGIGPSPNANIPTNQSNGVGTMNMRGVGTRMDQTTPNLAFALAQGKREAIRDQPFRAGYDVTTQVGEPDAEGKYQTRVSHMPTIGNPRPQRTEGPLASQYGSGFAPAGTQLGVQPGATASPLLGQNQRRRRAS